MDDHTAIANIKAYLLQIIKAYIQFIIVCNIYIFPVFIFTKKLEACKSCFFIFMNELNRIRIRTIPINIKIQSIWFASILIRFFIFHNIPSVFRLINAVIAVTATSRQY